MNHTPHDNTTGYEPGQSADNQTRQRLPHQQLQDTNQSALQAEATLAEQLNLHLETIRGGSTAVSSTVQQHPDFETLTPVLEKLYHLAEYLWQLPAHGQTPPASTTADDDTGSVDEPQDGQA